MDCFCCLMGAERSDSPVVAWFTQNIAYQGFQAIVLRCFCGVRLHKVDSVQLSYFGGGCHAVGEKLSVHSERSHRLCGVSLDKKP